MKPRIELLSETLLVGKKTSMSFAKIKTRELWQSFMPHRKEIRNRRGPEYYSVEIYPNLEYFDQFNPNTEFEKWAAISVKDFDSVPDKMDTLIIHEGLYAVFYYKGTTAEAYKTYQYIYANWIPNSKYQLDHRPHFALMGEKYKNNDPDSEEEFWIPISLR